MKINSNKKMLPLKLAIVLVVTLFSVMFINICSVNAADFKYKDFDADLFAEKNAGFWGICGEVDEKNGCTKSLVDSQKDFFKKLYKVLAKYESSGANLTYEEDYILLETIFINVSPDQSKTNNQQNYTSYWSSSSGSYEYDSETTGDEDLDADAEDYYITEKDSIKLLAKNLFSYKTKCYGVYGNATENVASDGSSSYSCESGTLFEDSDDNKLCGELYKANSLTYWEYSGKKVLGVLHSDESKTECEGIAENYDGGSAYVYAGLEASTVTYFEFLLNDKYFDGKAQLQSYFKSNVLTPASEKYGTNIQCLLSSVCDNSLESIDGAYENYDAEIKKSRQQIIDEIVSLLVNYGIDMDSYGDAYNANNIYSNSSSVRENYYWPIGSDEITEENSIKYAKGDPSSTTVVSYFGNRTNEATSNSEDHKGIDISGVDGVTNVIAAYKGEITNVVSNCSTGDYTCNDGYGNMVIISHSNGDYTVYAGLSSISENIKVGYQVKRGEVIGKVGTTGARINASLHFEIRAGGNSSVSAIDPSTLVSSSNPRPEIASGDFSIHETSLTEAEFAAKVTDYCAKNTCKTVFKNVFINNIYTVYQTSVDNNLNPEFTVIRAMVEGYSPGIDHSEYNNYWGIGCTNGSGYDACVKYSSLEDGIKGLANLKIVKNNDTAMGLMKKYSYIGASWYKIMYYDNGTKKDWGSGGCIYYPYIKDYLSDERNATVATYCTDSNTCTPSGGTCNPTTEEDQDAYTLYQVNNAMGNLRYSMFGL